MRASFRVLLLLPIVACTCDPPPEVPLPAKFSPAPNLPPSSYAVFVPGSDTPAVPGEDGTVEAVAKTKLAGFAMAVPREDAGLALAAESGIYLSPVPGGARLSGPPYAIGDGGTATIDATTTILSFVLQHPMFAHPAPDVQRRQVEWLANKVNAGWTAVADAARMYDTALSAGTDPLADAAFVTALQQAVTDAQEGMPEIVPRLDMYSEAAGGAEGPSTVTLANGTRVVTTVEKAGGNAVRTSTDTGTALDYLVVVRPIPASTFPGGKEDVAFRKAEPFATRSWGAPTSGGYVAASSYASYLDVVGNVMKWTTKFWSIPIAPSDETALGQPGFYEVRFFSGALGVGTPADEYEFVSTHFASDARAAFIHNVTAGLFEGIGLIPGAGEVFGSETGAQVGQEVVQQLVQDLEALLTSKGAALLEAEDIYNVAYNAGKAAIDKAAEKLTEDAQKSAWRQFFEWAKWGGKKAVKAVMDLPGKVAKGGSLAHRAARLTAPYSVSEVHLAYVEGAGLPEKIRGTTSITPRDPNEQFTFACDLEYELAGVRPKLSSERPQDGSIDRFFSVAVGQPARLTLTCANLTVSPRVFEYPEVSGQPKTVMTVKSVAFANEYADAAGSKGATIERSASGNTVRVDFTLAPVGGGIDYPFMSLVAGLVVRGDIERFDRTTGAVIETQVDVQLNSAPAYVGYHSVEGL